jgi:uncharacterized protein
MKLNLDTLAFGRSAEDVDETYRLDLEEGDAGEVRIRGELTVDNTEGRVVIGGTLESVGKADCDRCLLPFDMVYQADVSIVVVREGVEFADMAEEGTVWTEHQARGVIDLGPPLREAALLTMPQKMICRDDCRGICVHCGANRNEADCACDQDIVDPRWDGLPS